MRGKRFLMIFAAALVSLGGFARNFNGVADDIVGEYYLTHNGTESKVRVTRSSDGSYKAQVFWVKDMTGPDGMPMTDVKNPDKTMRSTPADKVVLFHGMKYVAEKNQWSGAKVYDPTRGIKANATCEFVSPDKLKVKGSLLGISESIIWQKLK